MGGWVRERKREREKERKRQRVIRYCQQLFSNMIFLHLCMKVCVYIYIYIQSYVLQHKGSGDVHQVWYDDPQSLRLKYKFADHMNMRGVGMWEADSLDYTDTPEGKQERADMWGALPDRK